MTEGVDVNTLILIANSGMVLYITSVQSQLRKLVDKYSDLDKRLALVELKKGA